MCEKTKILEQVSKGEITPQQAEDMLNSLTKESPPKSLFSSILEGISNIDIDINFGDNRIILEEIHSGSPEGGILDLDLHCQNGSIKVETWDSHQFQLTVKKRIKASTQEEAEEIASQYQCVDIQANRIKAGDPQCKTARRKISTSLFLQIPKDVKVAGSLITTNGSVSVSQISASSLRANTANGSIKFADVQGIDLETNTVNGSISVSGKTENLIANTTNGSIGLTTITDQGKLNLKTVNGSIRASLGIPQESAVDFTGTAVSGRVSIDHSVLGRQKGGRKLDYRTRNWESAANQLTIVLSTVNGSIKIKDNN